MFKSQTTKHKIFAIFLFQYLFISISGYCSPLKESLSIADSLFNEKKYTQAFEIYDDILTSSHEVTPSMLLKMAFIKEGLEDYTDALYYLNIYYDKTSDKRALLKMQDMAKKHNLEGYDYSDTQFFLNIFHRYYSEITFAILAITLFVFSIMIYRARVTKKRPIFSGSVFILFLTFLFYLNNFGRENPKAIIFNNQVYLMKGPSAGADVIEIVKKGHRVEVLGHEDVWTKIEWDNQIAYVKSDNLKTIKL